MKEVMEKLKELIKQEREKNRKDNVMYYFKESLRMFDLTRIEEILESDFSLKEYEEQNGSSITGILIGFENQIFDGYLTKGKRLDDAWKIIKQYLEMEKEDLPLDVVQFLEQITEGLLNILEKLYQKGANININEYTSTSYGLLREEKEVHEIDSPILVILSFLDHIKSDKVIGWLLNKPELDLSQNNAKKSILERVIESHVKLSVPVLNELLNRGVKINDITIPAPLGMAVPPISELHLCLLKSPGETRDEKLDLLYQHATPEQIARLEEYLEAKNISNKII